MKIQKNLNSSLISEETPPTKLVRVSENKWNHVFLNYFWLKTFGKNFNFWTSARSLDERNKAWRFYVPKNIIDKRSKPDGSHS